MRGPVTGAGPRASWSIMRLTARNAAGPAARQAASLAPASPPGFSVQLDQGAVRVSLAGVWTSQTAHAAETVCVEMAKAVQGQARVELDLAGVERLDTAGAWLISRIGQGAADSGASASFANANAEHAVLLEAAHYRSFARPQPKSGSRLTQLFADVGFAVVAAGRDLVHGIAFLGELIVCFARSMANPRLFRGASFVFHMESFAYRSVPIIALINFLVGGIVAQQGIFQLRRFGASTFAVDLIGVLVCRELAVLLTCIMVAGRSGSAITAEIGSMKMREEIDALRVMGLDPVDVLIAPRVLALIVSLCLLTFVADISAIFGGMVVAWAYEGMSPTIYLERLQTAIGWNTFMVGMIKAPFMALVIGLIASIEGLAVGGSAESLGRQVTDSVVKSIFMVIALDGLFAMFFAAINY